MTAFAIRQRSFHDPHPVDDLRQEAKARRQAYLQERKAGIARIRQEFPEESETYCAMVFDLERSEATTSGRAQLLEHGIVPVPPQELDDPTHLHDELWTILEALAKSGIFLLNTDHLNDRDLYCRLYYKILDEPTRLMPPETEAAEFIDVLHGLDQDFPLGKALLKRQQEGDSFPRSTEYQRGPQCSSLGVLQGRDSHLPRPNWG